MRESRLNRSAPSARRGLRRAIGASLALALLLAACGGGDDAPAPAPEPEPAPTEEPDDEPDGEMANGGECDGVDREPFEAGIVSAPPGSAAFLVAGQIAEWVRQADTTDYITLTAEASGGMVENVNLVEGGESLMGWGSTAIMYDAMNAEGAFDGQPPLENIRGTFPGFESSWHIVTYDDSIETISDLEGMRVNVGTPGGSNAVYAEAAFRAVGIWDSLDIERQSDSDAVSLLQDGLIDAFSVIGPAPFPPVQEAAAAPGRTLHMIDISEALDGVPDNAPGTSSTLVPADIYGDGIPANDYPSFGHILYLIATEEVAPCAMYDMMTELLSEEGQQFLADGYGPVGLAMQTLPNFDPLLNAGIPLHPGAVIYWQEQGEDVPAELIP